LERVRKAGVRVVTGTDSGFMLPHAKVNAHELTLLVKGGFSPLEAITAATATSCDLLGIDAGRLEPGRLADVVLVAGDPVNDITILEDAARLRVFREGTEIL
jgi:imidazolonepropionase-like amidohydrolase